MKKINLLTRTLLLFALIVVSTSVWAQTILFHETFGDNSDGARVWNDSYSVKSGIAAIYEQAEYSLTNVKQGKNTTGSTKSGLNQTTKGTDAVFIVGPLNVKGYNGLTLKYQWNAASIKGTYSTSASYSSSLGGTYTTIETFGNTAGATAKGATSFVECEYTIPAAACTSSLYVKIVFNTSNVGAIIDEIDLSCSEPVLPVTEDNIPVCTMSIATCDYSKPTWTHKEISAYTLGNGATEIPTKTYGEDTYALIKLPAGKTYNITVPAGVAVTKIAITGKSASDDGTSITVGEKTSLIKSTISTAYYPIATPSAGASVSFSTVSKEFGLESIVLYTNDGITLTTTANMDGWRSFYDATQDYEVDANTSIYVAAKSANSGEVELTKKDGITKIPHGEAVILKTTAGDHKMTLTKTTGAATLGANVLAYAVSAAVDGYRLGYKSGTGVAFYKYTATAPASGVVYIDKANVNTGAGAHEFLALSFGDTTGINAVEAKKAENGVYYNLAGQQVAQPTKGLYIVNGKKVIIK